MSHVGERSRGAFEKIGAVGKIPVFVLGFICVAITVAFLIRHGIKPPPTSLLELSASIKHLGQYHVDPMSATFIPSSFPTFFRFFADIYDVPFYNLLFGLLTKFLIACGFLALTWRITRSVLACFLAEIMLFGLADLIIVEVDIPLGVMSHYVRKNIFFSFRQIATAIAILATIVFVKRQYVLCSLLLGLGFHFHPLNTTVFFMSFNAALLLCLLLKEDKKVFFRAALKLSIPFLVLVSPSVWMNARMFSGITPMPSTLWWEFILKNEPDDGSIIYHLRQRTFIKELFLTAVAASLYVLVRSGRPVTKASAGAFIRARGDLVLPLLVAPWAIAAFAVVWESWLIWHVPDFFNDIFIPLQLKRVPTVSAFLYIPILAGVVSSSLLLVTEKGLAELGFGHRGERRASLDVVLGVGLSCLLVVFVWSRGSSKGVDLKRHWTFEHRRYEYLGLERSSPISYFDYDSKLIPQAAYLDVCRFIRNNTPETAAFFNPTYLNWFLAYCDRQRFLSEKSDGSYAIMNRRFATIYLKRFSDIHNGLTYKELPGLVVEGGEAYGIMRKRYMSLTEADLQRLGAMYPGYRYFLTEVGHTLPYRVIYTNDYFLLYDLGHKNEPLWSSGRSATSGSRGEGEMPRS